MSISNNIAEGSCSFSDKDFAHFLNVSRRSIFECANIFAILLMRGCIDEEKKSSFFHKLDHLSSMIVNFRKKTFKR